MADQAVSLDTSEVELGEQPKKAKGATALSADEVEIEGAPATPAPPKPSALSAPAQPAPQGDGTSMRAAPEPDFTERVRRTIMGAPGEETLLGRAVHSIERPFRSDDEQRGEALAKPYEGVSTGKAPRVAALEQSVPKPTSDLGQSNQEMLKFVSDLSAPRPAQALVDAGSDILTPESAELEKMTPEERAQAAGMTPDERRNLITKRRMGRAEGALDEPLLPVNEFWRQQMAKVPNDESAWMVNSLIDAGTLTSDVASGFSTPKNLLMLKLLQIPANTRATSIAKVLIDLGFTIDMARAAGAEIGKGLALIDMGQFHEGGQTIANGLTSAVFSMMSAKGAMSGGAAYRDLRRGERAGAPPVDRVDADPRDAAAAAAQKVPAGAPQPQGTARPKGKAASGSRANDVEVPASQQVQPTAAPAGAVSLAPEEVEIDHAAQPIQQQGSVQPERVGADEVGQTTETGARDRVQDAAGSQKEGAPEAGQQPERPDTVERKSRTQQVNDLGRLKRGEVAATQINQTVTELPKGMERASVGGREYAYDPSKTNPEAIREHVERGEEYKITGERPTHAKVDEAKAATKPVPEPSEAKPPRATKASIKAREEQEYSDQRGQLKLPDTINFHPADESEHVNVSRRNGVWEREGERVTDPQRVAALDKMAEDPEALKQSQIKFLNEKRDKYVEQRDHYAKGTHEWYMFDASINSTERRLGELTGKEISRDESKAEIGKQRPRTEEQQSQQERMNGLRDEYLKGKGLTMEAARALPHEEQVKLSAEFVKFRDARLKGEKTEEGKPYTASQPNISEGGHADADEIVEVNGRRGRVDGFDWEKSGGLKAYRVVFDGETKATKVTPERVTRVKQAEDFVRSGLRASIGAAGGEIIGADKESIRVHVEDLNKTYTFPRDGNSIEAYSKIMEDRRAKKAAEDAAAPPKKGKKAKAEPDPAKEPEPEQPAQEVGHDDVEHEAAGTDDALARRYMEDAGLKYKEPLKFGGKAVYMGEHPDRPGDPIVLPGDKLTPEALAEKIKAKLGEPDVEDLKKKHAIPEVPSASTIGQEEPNAGTDRATEQVPSVQEPQGGRGNAPDEVSTEGVREPATEREAGRSAERADAERVAGDGAGAQPGREPERGGGDRAAEHPAAERTRRSRKPSGEHQPEGADGQPVTAPIAENSERASHTAAEVRNSRNYRITDEDAIGSGGEIGKIKQNLDSLELLKKIQAEGREVATPEEQRALAKYVDFGGLSSIFNRRWNSEYTQHADRLERILDEAEIQEIRETVINSHYTSIPVVDWMWKVAGRLGFKGGRLLEPSIGIGNFFGRMPEEISKRSEIYGVEKNPLSGAMARMLYPDAKIRVDEFQKFLVPNNSLDFVIGNAPFSEVKVIDPLYKDPKMSLHNYFIVKGLDKLREGGVMAMITTHYTLDSTTVSSQRARQAMADRADLIAAIRLPNTAFKGNAGTEVVTDMLIFRKRASGAPYSGEPFQGTKMVPGPNGAQAPVNEYFGQHTEHVLGKHSFAGSMYRGNEYTVEPFAGKSLQEHLDSAIETVPQDIYGKRPAGQHLAPPPAADPFEMAPEHIKNGSYYADEKGKVWKKVSGVRAALEGDLGKGETLKRIKDAIEVRDSLNRLISTQLATGEDAEIKPVQKELNKAYDAYVKAHGPLSGPKTAKAFGDDPEYPKLLALENIDPKTKEVSKAPMFTQRTLAPYEPLADLPREPKTAMLKVLADQGWLNTDLMASLQKRAGADVIKELEDSNLAFRDPVGGKYHTSDEYLSGNVREKLKQAKAAAEVDPAFERNVKELEKVQPKPLTIHEIQPKLGMTWIPATDYAEFIKHLGKQPYGEVKVSRDATGEWKVALGRYFNEFDLRHKWGAGGMAGDEIMEYALNQRPITIYKGSKEERTVDQPATIAARAKVQEIRDAFVNWVRSGDVTPQEGVVTDRGTRLAEIYNDVFNGIRLRDFDGAHLDHPGLSNDITTRPYQANAEWRIVQDGRALLAHDVGLGKTLTMVNSAMQLRRMGLSRKNLIAVPNHMVEQWRKDFLKHYPGANVLMVRDEDFTAKNRQRLMSRIATGDWDAVILPHSQFDLLPMSPEYEKKVIDQKLGEAREVMEDLAKDSGNKKSVKQIEKAIDKMEARLLELNNAKKDNAITFDQLGVDQVFVDEAHAYKALPFFSRMGSISGLSTRASQRALKMEMKSQYMYETHKGRGVVFATGTPVTNTLGELYVMTRFLAPDMLEKAGIRTFDDWAANFATTVTNWEYSPDGVTFRPKTALAEFTNVPELQNMVRMYADFQTKAQAKLKEPTPARKDTTVKSTDIQAPLLYEIAKRGEALMGPMSSRPDPTEDNWLKLSSDARKISLDPRLYDPSLPDHKDSKANHAARIVKDVLDRTNEEKGTVVLFSDIFQNVGPDGKVRFNLFHDVRDKLIKAGFDRDKIAIIHDFDKKDAKQSLFDRVNSGDVRVLMGSTDKMGIGTNIQKRLKALVHLDQPWRPDQVEQREGRIIRHGNMHDDIEIYRLIAEPPQAKMKVIDHETGEEQEIDYPRAYDLQMYQQLARKQTFIEQFKDGRLTGRNVEDAAGNVMLNAQMFQLAKAMASGNPDAMRKVKLQHELQTTNMLQRSYDVQRSRNRSQLEQTEMHVDVLNDRKKLIDSAIEKWQAADEGKVFSAEVDGKEFTDRAELVKYLEANPGARHGEGFRLYDIEIPTREHTLPMRGGKMVTKTEYKLAGEWHDFPIDENGNPSMQGFLRSVQARGAEFENYRDEVGGWLRKNAETIERLRGEMGDKSPYEEKLRAMQKELEEIDTRLGIRGGGMEDEIGDATKTAPDAPSDDNSGESGFARTGALPPVALAEAAVRGGMAIKNLYARMTEKLLEKVQLGRSHPEVRKYDNELADLMTKVDAGYQYHSAIAKHAVDDVVGGLSREQEKGFVMMADEESRDWLRDNKPDEYRQYVTDPKIVEALQRYKPYEETMRQAVVELGGHVLDRDYLHRVYDKYTAGINKKDAKGRKLGGTPFDDLISPQIDRLRGRTMEPDYYYEHGLHEFGPSFATRWVSVMTKLDENAAAWEFIAKATKLKPEGELPNAIYYNGKVYYSGDMARQIREATPGPSSEALAKELGVKQLPKPKDVEEYGIYEPLKGGRLEMAAADLARGVFAGKSPDFLAGRAAQVSRAFQTRFAGPKPIIDVLTHAKRNLIPTAIQSLMAKAAPATQFLRQQIIGLGFMVHFANDMRRVAQTVHGGVANPVGWVRALNVAFSKDLKARAVKGVGDETFDMLLRNAAISQDGIQEYKRYVELNLDPKSWTNAFRKGGQAEGKVTTGAVLASPFKVAAEGFRAGSKVGHDILFGQGGMDQRSRLWLADFLRERAPHLNDAQIAHMVNEQFGRYNRASWTQLQREIAPLMLFPGWDYSSMAYVLKHPLRTALPPAVVMLLANRILHHYGLNNNDDKNDPLYLHIGGHAISASYMREPLANRLMGAPIRFAQSKLKGRSTMQAAGDAAAGVPRDVAGATINLAHPFVSGAMELAANRERLGSGKEIINHGDTKRRGKVLRGKGGKAVEDVAGFAGRKALPYYDRVTDDKNAVDVPGWLGNYVGVQSYSTKKKKK